MKDGWQDLGDTVFALARDAILVQRRLDEGIAELRERFAATLSALPEPTRRLMLPLAPAGIAVGEHRVRCALRVSTSRSAALQLVAKPINAGYAALYGMTRTEQSSLTVEVRRAPAPRPPSP